MKPSALHVPVGVVEDTLTYLRTVGDRHSEGVVLWLGHKESSSVAVTEAFVPQQQAAQDYFRIPARGMSALLAHLRKSHAFIAAQVHSHPREAFHSQADDRWAIVRHLGALSLVVPNFARGTSVGNFRDQAATFRLSATNVWQELSVVDREQSIKIV